MSLHHPQTQSDRAITAIQMDAQDSEDFNNAVEQLRAIINRHLDSVWTFKDKKYPDIWFEGVRFLKEESKPQDTGQLITFSNPDYGPWLARRQL